MDFSSSPPFPMSKEDVQMTEELPSLPPFALLDDDMELDIELFPSPPTAANTQLPSLPARLPTLASFAPSSPSEKSLKRRPPDDDSCSSDPLFSDEASDPGLPEVGERARRKRKVRGPWWTLEDKKRKPPPSAKDSGVFMGSDASVSASPSSSAASKAVPPLKRISAAKKSSPAEELAGRIISNCLDNGKEAIDLSDLAFRTIPEETLRPLHQLIRNANVNTISVPTAEQYTSLTPRIQMFLANNRLTTLPRELFKLEYITVLSLRNNELTELSSSIAQLRRLREVNLSSNRLRYLPWEAMPFIRARDNVCRVIVQPNPFYSIALQTLDAETTAAVRLNLELGQQMHGHQQLIFLISGPVNYLDAAATNMRLLPTSDATLAQDFTVPAIEPTPPPLDRSHANAPPSLLELTLRLAQKLYDLEGAPYAPTATIAHAMRTAARDAKQGGERCSTCKNEYIFPKAEWLEYWYMGNPTHGLSADKIIPFRRLACSHRCAKASAAGTGYAMT
ncbi:hypothetical protein B0A48_05683 [Cryoendolithus antarcticus]|uniref:Glucose-repressible alcohol dehydrogenase transcriptional effector n=1 Tax=Cryoendolithus antarcticus TaxID=1507870 RepID=A0A1V8TBL6_9PEZI|nr:hypothetical protein B0A48_05683 [Cryoendolithus antarcticus]